MIMIATNLAIKFYLKPEVFTITNNFFNSVQLSTTQTYNLSSVKTISKHQVFTITNNFPAHPAGSFHYPALSRLPRLAVYSLTKVKLFLQRI